MLVQNVKINGMKNPVGFLWGGICCSWEVSRTNSKKQSYVKIEVSDAENFQHVLYRKEGKELKQGGEMLDISCQPRTIYYVRVTVTGDLGDEAVSEPAFFETGKMDEPWAAKFIAAEKGDNCHPVMQRRFRVSKEVKSARLYAAGAGLFEANMNGKKLGDEYLTPYINNYEDHLQVITFSAEELLQGENVLEICLGKGWYMGRFGMPPGENTYGSRMAVIAELHLLYEDGQKEVIATDENWNYYPSDIIESGIYDGEWIDRTAGEERMSMLRPADVLCHPEKQEETRALNISHLVDRSSLPIRVHEILPVQEILDTLNGDIVLDFGQNFAGFVEMHVKQPRGTKIVLEFGEIMQNSNFYNGNYRTANSQFVYISNGEEETVRPHFTYFGFRYVRVSGWKGSIRKEDFKGLVLYSELERTGYLETSNAMVNRLYENTLWGLKSNFMDLPTDCPQRDERLGWTGDAQVFAPTASYHMDTRAFYHKFLQDLREEQIILGGRMPNYLPNPRHDQTAGSIWGDAAALIPDTLYRYYGDLEEMKNFYPLMKDWVDSVDRQDEARGKKYLFDFAFSFGDWLALDGMTPSSFKGNTNDDFLSSMYYCRSVQIVKEMAERLHRSEDAAHYAELESRITKAIFEEFFTVTGRLAIDTQAAYVCTLNFGICPDREKVLGQFRERLKKDGFQLRCGFAGAPLLCTVLADNGMAEQAYDFLLNENFPGWLYCVKLGATTVWERWNSVLPDGKINPAGMNSLNHYSYGSVAEFLYKHVGGIQAMEPGFARARIAPKPDVRLSSVNCRYHSVNGMYRCEYEILPDGQMKVHIEIPFNCQAQVELPAYAGGAQILDAGSYDYLYRPVINYRKPYHLGTTLGRLSKDANAMKILEKYAPVYAGMAASGEVDACSNTLLELSFNDFIPRDPEKVKQAMREIEELTVQL